MKKTRTVLLVFVLISCPLLFTSQKSDRKYSQNDLNSQSVLSILWFQQASEVKALYYQAYNLARMKLDQFLNNNRNKNNLAIITDLDETILDNSPWEAGLIGTNKSYPEGWDDWCKLSKARALPGSVDFFKYAAARGIEIFYISNRKSHLLNPTIKNMKKLKFPCLDKKNFLLRDSSTGRSKKSRRDSVAQNHTIILLLGDNLGDFDEAFDIGDMRKRQLKTSELFKNFGERFILFPNPMYGGWESTWYPKNPSIDQKIKVRKGLLQKN